MTALRLVAPSARPHRARCEGQHPSCLKCREIVEAHRAVAPLPPKPRPTLWIDQRTPKDDHTMADLIIPENLRERETAPARKRTERINAAFGPYTRAEFEDIWDRLLGNEEKLKAIVMRASVLGWNSATLGHEIADLIGATHEAICEERAAEDPWEHG